MKKQQFFTLPRIIGSLLIIISIIARMNRATQWAALAIAGAILLLAPTKHAKTNFDNFIKTFSSWKTIILTGFYDAIYWMLVFGGLYFFQWRLQLKAVATQTNAILSKAALLNPATSGVTSSAIKSLYSFLIIAFISLIVYFILVYVVSRAFMWTTLAKQKLTKKWFLHFLGLNSVWWVLCSLPVIMVILGSSQVTNKALAVQGGLFMSAAIFIYFAPFLQTQFTKTHSIKKSMGHGLALGITKLYQLIINR